MQLMSTADRERDQHCDGTKGLRTGAGMNSIHEEPGTGGPGECGWPATLAASMHVAPDAPEIGAWFMGCR